MRLNGAVTGNRRRAPEARATPDGRTTVPLRFAKDGSVFVVFRPKGAAADDAPAPDMSPVMRNVSGEGGLAINGPWKVRLDASSFDRMGDWTKSDDPAVRYFSGTAVYTTSFTLGADGMRDRLLMLGTVAGGLAEVFVNGTDCGIVWCAPWYAKIPVAALRKGANSLEVRVTNTWRNRLIGDCLLPPGERAAKCNLLFKSGPHNDVHGGEGFRDYASGYSANDSLVSCGLYGPVCMH